ncbi:hypothetical protein SAMN05192588_0947 [Nonlabens sp. Hel1_33_55]|uniref:hypothetical protein n=1 Tax=Nonlabens sp. Hel1_33_55 TaxID=1336802 RepID=UPI000875AC32|nr:hypothetical protein [Nonlabens sp. Hel1_33_55]SCY06208.1 hypothetical protein SAMN05192588_0947 [Nonlabens sp. Hel1_33_55]
MNKYLVQTVFYCTLLISCTNKSNENINQPNFVKENNDVEEVQRLESNLKDLISQIKMSEKNYTSNLKGSDFKNLLKPLRIKNDVQHIESNRILFKVDSLLENQKSKTKEISTKIFVTLDSIKEYEIVSDLQINSIKSEIENFIVVSSKNRELDSLILNSNKAMIMFLNGECDYKIENNQFIFANEACLRQFNLKNMSINFAELKTKSEINSQKTNDLQLQIKEFQQRNSNILDKS